MLLPDFSPAHLDVPRWRTSNLYHRSVVRNLEVEPPCRSSPDYSVPALLAIYLGPGLPTSLCQYPSNWTFSPGVWQKKTVLKGLGLPWWLSGKEPACNAGDLGLIPGLGRFPQRRKFLPTTVFLPGKSHGQRGLAGYSPGGCKESDMTETTPSGYNLGLWIVKGH